MKKRTLLLLLVLLMTFASTGALAKGRPSGGGAMPEAGTQTEETESEEERMERLLEEAKQDRLEKIRKERTAKEKYYDNNTVCSFGPQFREVSKRLTDEWYMFTPVDLSEDGVQTFDLIAGNMYVIGEVTVTVKNGTVKVDYSYSSTGITAGREYFTIFKDYEDITRKELENLPKGFTYGKTYNIEDKLDGDTDVILFVCNTATFRKTTRGVVSYYSTNPDRVALRETLLEMIGK